MKQQNAQVDQRERLFLSLADELSQTFLRLTRMAETAPLLRADDQVSQWGLVHDVTSSAMLLTEAYAHNARLVQHITVPEIEPVTVSSLFYDALQQLQPLARQYNIEIVLADLPRMSPVMSDALVLQAALVSLGQVFVAAEAQLEKPGVLYFSAHRSRYGVVAGVYSEESELSADAFQRSKALFGTAHQPLSRLTNAPATGVFIADNLLQAVSAKLHVARYKNLTGLATTLPICNQLQLV